MSSLSLPDSASASTLAASFSLNPVWSSADPSSADVLAASTDSSDSTATDVLRTSWSMVGNSAPNTAWVLDPFDAANGADVLQVTYPEGTRDGTQFTMRVFDNFTSEWNQTAGTALLKYELAFSDDFDFVLGGKLPGLYGANNESTKICSGGKQDEDCFSARLMWRQRGAGEVYAYLPTYSGFCSQSDVLCNVGDDVTYGVSLSRGSFRFKTGEWATITQLISLNTPGYANGLLYLYHNDELALAHTGLSWRMRDDVSLSSVFFSSFFGGSGNAWNSKGGNAYFRRFEVYASAATSNTSGPAVNASATGGWSAAPPSHTSTSLPQLVSLFLFSALLLSLSV
ncbi:hypothetical protein JCM6882_009699 [Rhodosporidiobolus microsporus]